MIVAQTMQQLIEDITAQNKSIPYRVRFRTADMPGATWSEYRPYKGFQQEYEKVISAEFHFMDSYVTVEFENGDYRISEPVILPKNDWINYSCITCPDL